MLLIHSHPLAMFCTPRDIHAKLPNPFTTREPSYLDNPNNSLCSFRFCLRSRKSSLFFFFYLLLCLGSFIQISLSDYPTIPCWLCFSYVRRIRSACDGRLRTVCSGIASRWFPVRAPPWPAVDVAMKETLRNNRYLEQLYHDATPPQLQRQQQ